jgi:hypothetical protein
LIAGVVRGEGARVRSVLELGSGPGLLAARVLETCAGAIERYVLLDHSPPMLEMSRARVAGYAAVRCAAAGGVIRPSTAGRAGLAPSHIPHAGVPTT